MVGRQFVWLSSVFLGRIGLFLPILVRIDPFLRTVRLGVQSSGKIKQAGRDVDMADQGLVPNSALFLVGIAHHEGYAQAALVNRGLSSAKAIPWSEVNTIIVLS